LAIPKTLQRSHTKSNPTLQHRFNPVLTFAITSQDPFFPTMGCLPRCGHLWIQLSYTQTTKKNPMTSSQTDIQVASERCDAAPQTEPFTDSIAKRAYFLYLNSAAPHGQDLDHWLLAEKQTNSERRRRRL
jgi:hypothetical protein